MDLENNKDSLLIIESNKIVGYELGGVTRWQRHPNDAIIYEKNGVVKVVEFEGGTVIYDKREIVERYFSVFLKQEENEKNGK